MIDAVFISDLHLHPKDADITERFTKFIDWAGHNTRSVYILGDFFHVWPGDDALDAWSKSIATQLTKLASSGIKLYFLHGNRDFLLGPRFAKLASLTLLQEPAVITLGDCKVLLVHGDRYCTNDKGHQWLRRLTRNSIFPRLFLRLPYKIRAKLVNEVRQRSQANRSKSMADMDIVTPVMISHMREWGVDTVIHGHIHRPGHTVHGSNEKNYHQYVLSDWDDNPSLLCYDNPKGLYFDRLIGE